jgi:hypothetical protein
LTFLLSLMSCVSSDESGELRASKFGLCTAANFEPGGQSFTNTRSSKAQSIRCADDSNFFASHYPPSRVLEDLSLIFSIFAQSQKRHNSTCLTILMEASQFRSSYLFILTLANNMHSVAVRPSSRIWGFPRPERCSAWHGTSSWNGYGNSALL